MLSYFWLSCILCSWFRQCNPVVLQYTGIGCVIREQRGYAAKIMSEIYTRARNKITCDDRHSLMSLGPILPNRVYLFTNISFIPIFIVFCLVLIVHLLWEARVGGTVQFRWIYSQERELKKFRDTVRHRAMVEGCIAEAFTAKEIMNFSSMYFSYINNVNAHTIRYDAIPYSRRSSIE
jgi:hypothetical protein